MTGSVKELREKKNKVIRDIKPLDSHALEEARKRQDVLAKVPGSLGSLEEISIRIAGITGKVTGNQMDNQGIIVFCGDNGVVEEGVASAPQTVTLMQTINFTKGITGVSSQAKYFGMDLLVVDVGVKLPIPGEYLTEEMVVETPQGKTPAKKVVSRRLVNGTKNLAKEAAMDRETALKALLIGVEGAKAMADCHKNIMGVGEMGIGNTTPAAILICKLTGASPQEVVGRGGGLDDQGLAKKLKVVKEALNKYDEEYGQDILGFAAAIGGAEILAMTGAFLGAASLGIPAVIDGYISIAAALLAAEIEPKVKDYLFTSHMSQEPGYRKAVEKLGIKPMFDLGMKLGEASGCPIAFKIIEAATAAMNGMKTLEEGQIDFAYLEELKAKGNFI